MHIDNVLNIIEPLPFGSEDRDKTAQLAGWAMVILYCVKIIERSMQLQTSQ